MKKTTKRDLLIVGAIFGWVTILFLIDKIFGTFLSDISLAIIILVAIFIPIIGIPIALYFVFSDMEEDAAELHKIVKEASRKIKDQRNS